MRSAVSLRLEFGKRPLTSKSFINGISDDLMCQTCLASLWVLSVFDEKIPTGF